MAAASMPRQTLQVPDGSGQQPLSTGRCRLLLGRKASSHAAILATGEADVSSASVHASRHKSQPVLLSPNPLGCAADGLAASSLGRHRGTTAWCV